MDTGHFIRYTFLGKVWSPLLHSKQPKGALLDLDLLQIMGTIIGHVPETSLQLYDMVH